MAKTENKPVEFVRESALTLPLVKLEEGKAYHLQFTSEIAVQSKSDKKADEKDMEVVDVVDLDTGVEARLALTAVIASAIKRMDNPLKGKKIEIIDKGKVPGKRYHDYEIWRLK